MPENIPQPAPEPTAVPAPDPAAAAQAAAERERIALHRLSRLHEVPELQACALALLLPPGSKRARQVWNVETEGTPQADELRIEVKQLSAATRLPCFEWLLARMGTTPMPDREALLAATRRVMGARGVVRTIDRLYWLSMRQRLGEASLASPRAAAEVDISKLPQADVMSIASYSAFLSHLVPTTPARGDEGAAWYTTVMRAWWAEGDLPPRDRPDTDGLVQALHELQLMPWMQRPVVVRGWVSAALQHSRLRVLDDDAADALRLSCSLLDCPMPPELAQHYREIGTDLAGAAA